MVQLVVGYFVMQNNRYLDLTVLLYLSSKRIDVMPETGGKMDPVKPKVELLTCQ